MIQSVIDASIVYLIITILANNINRVIYMYHALVVIKMRVD